MGLKLGTKSAIWTHPSPSQRIWAPHWGAIFQGEHGAPQRDAAKARDKHLQAAATALWPHVEHLKTPGCQKSAVQRDPLGEEEIDGRRAGDLCSRGEEVSTGWAAFPRRTSPASHILVAVDDYDEFSSWPKKTWPQPLNSTVAARRTTYHQNTETFPLSSQNAHWWLPSPRRRKAH